MPPTTLERTVQVHKALAHPARMRIIGMLRGGALCACQITAVLDLAPSTVSAHLAELRRAGLVSEQKKGRWVHFRLAPSEEAAGAVESLWPLVRRDPQVRSDMAVVKQLRSVPVAELCGADLDLSRFAITRTG